MTVNYQSLDEGGCSNTSCDADTDAMTDGGTDAPAIVQRTAVARTTTQGTHLALP